MSRQIFKRPGLLTKLEVWKPRYHDKKDGGGQWIALLACYKVDAGSPWILVEFTKAPHLQGLRYCIKRTDAQPYPKQPNGTIDCYAVPMDKLDTWETLQEIRDYVEEQWPAHNAKSLGTVEGEL